jgi:hypothetical protein
VRDRVAKRAARITTITPLIFEGIGKLQINKLIQNILQKLKIVVIMRNEDLSPVTSRLRINKTK